MIKEETMLQEMLCPYCDRCFLITQWAKENLSYFTCNHCHKANRGSAREEHGVLIGIPLEDSDTDERPERELNWCDICMNNVDANLLSCCDGCEATYCMSHISRNGICPLCHKRHTSN